MFERGVAGVTRLDCMRSEEIRKALKQEAMVTQVIRKREWWKTKRWRIMAAQWEK